MFSSFPYLFLSISSFILIIIASRKLLNPQQNTIVVLSGLTILPSFGFTFLFESSYWAPVRLGGWVLGIEDVLCAYALGAMVWFATIFRFGPIVREKIAFFEVYKRYSVVAVISAVIFFAFYFLGFNPMTAYLWMSFIVGIGLFIWFPSLRKFAIAGLWKFPILYLVSLKMYFLIWPDFVLQWNATAPWGRLYFGVPLGEIAWAVSFGFYWPLFVGYVFKIRPEIQKNISG